MTSTSRTTSATSSRTAWWCTCSRTTPGRSSRGRSSYGPAPPSSPPARWVWRASPANVLRTGGTTNIGADELDETLERMGGNIESFIGDTSGRLSFSFLSQDAEPGPEPRCRRAPQSGVRAGQDRRGHGGREGGDRPPERRPQRHRRSRDPARCVGRRIIPTPATPSTRRSRRSPVTTWSGSTSTSTTRTTC